MGGATTAPPGRIKRQFPVGIGKLKPSFASISRMFWNFS